MSQLLSVEQISNFKRDGVVVIPILSATEVEQTRFAASKNIRFLTEVYFI